MARTTTDLPPARSPGPMKDSSRETSTQGEAQERRRPFNAGNYADHGGGKFRNRGYSLDLFLNAQLDDRGFYPRADAVVFLGQVGAAAKATGLGSRVLYNDFAVAAK